MRRSLAADGRGRGGQLSALSTRTLASAELDRIVEIDRSEPVAGFYVQSGTELDFRPVTPFIGGWPSVPETVQFCRDHVGNGALALGVFGEERLVGIGILTSNLLPGVAQLAFMHVSAAYRRQGIATALWEQLVAHARATRHRSVYVTATPTLSAVGFYRRLGFRPSDSPVPHLLELEPEDIHMSVAL